MKKPPKKATAQTLLSKYNWHKVIAPTVWRPTGPEELIGYYGGRTIRTGTFGPYDVVIVHVPYKGSYIVSGVRLIQLVDAAQLTKGDPIRVAFRGYQPSRGDQEMKLFDLFVVDGDRLDEEDMPEVEFS